MIARVVKLIQSEVTEGLGVVNNPLRGVTYFHTMDGKLVARIDRHEEQTAREENERLRQLLADNGVKTTPK